MCTKFGYGVKKDEAKGQEILAQSLEKMIEEAKNIETKAEDTRPLLLYVEDLIPILGIRRRAAYLLVHKG